MSLIIVPALVALGCAMAEPVTRAVEAWPKLSQFVLGGERKVRFGAFPGTPATVGLVERVAP